MEQGSTPLPHKSTTHKEHYAHIREPFFDEADCELPKWQGGTVFARLEDNVWYATAALCVRQDQFDRHKGRTIARRRYFSHPGYQMGYKLLTPANELPTFEQLRAVYLNACHQSARRGNT